MSVARSMSFPAPSREFFVDDFFGGAATEGERDHVFSFGLRKIERFFFRKRPCQTESHSARNDRDLMNRIRAVEFDRNERMTRFVKGRDAPYLLPRSPSSGVRHPS